MKITTRIAPAVALALLLASTALAQVQLTRVTGTVVNASGAPVPNARLTITKVLKGGVVVSSRPVPVAADSSGVVSFDVLRNSVAYLEGSVVGFEREGGVPVTIPDAPTAAFETLVPVASVPPSNLTTHAAVQGSSGTLGHLKCGAGVTCSGGVISSNPVTDHGALTGLSDDDHAQYLNTTRGDARYYTRAQAGGLLALKAALSHTHLRADITDFAHTHAVADTTGLQAALDAKASSADLSAEAGARAAADTTLQANIAAEASSRAAADTTLQANVTAEAAARAAGDALALAKASNLSDLGSAATARSNLGLGTAATLNVPASGNAAAGEVVKGSDTRLADARTPTGHASTHAAAGSDPVTLAQSQVTGLTADLAGKQPLDSDLTAVAGLSPSANDVLQFVSGAWAARTTAQLKASLAISAGDVSGLGTMATQAETAYALLAGRAGGQTLSGGSAASESLTLQSTNHATKGYILLGTGGLVGVNKSVPLAQAHVQANAAGTRGLIVQTAASPTANAQEWQDSTGAVVASIGTAGGAFFPSVALTSNGAVAVVTSGGNLRFNTGFSARWDINSGGTLLPIGNNALDIGSSSNAVRNGYFGTNVVSPKVQIGTTTAKGTCDSSARGTLYAEFGGAGVADKIYQCLKSSSDTYSWVQIVSAP